MSDLPVRTSAEQAVQSLRERWGLDEAAYFIVKLPRNPCGRQVLGMVPSFGVAPSASWFPWHLAGVEFGPYTGGKLRR